MNAILQAAAAQLLTLGYTVADVRGMTRRQLDALTRRVRPNPNARRGKKDKGAA